MPNTSSNATRSQVLTSAPSLTKTLSKYYQLTKPGIIYGNALTAAGGFFLASRGHINFGLFVTMLAGISLVIAAGCVCNNYIDRGIDKKMTRTKQRALVSGTISGRSALFFSALLAIAGISTLAIGTNLLTLSLGLIGLFTYVVLYGIGKRRSVHGTLIGSIAGAVPPVVGYCAVTNNLNAGAVIVFLILVCWQMPHFYAIALYRRQDYAAAGLPVLSVKKGPRITKVQIMSYITIFTLTTVALTVYGYTGYSYAIVMVLLGLAWFGLGIRKLKKAPDAIWGRSMFLFSLIVILSFSVMMAFGPLLP